MNRRRFSILFSTFALSVSLCALVLAASSSRRLIEVVFTGVGSYTWKSASTVPAGASIDMTFLSGTYTEDFYFGYIRSNVVHDILFVTNKHIHTLTWYFPREQFFKPGDELIISNSIAQPAVFALSSTFQ